MPSLGLRRIGGALSAFWAGGEGPSRSQVLGALAVAGCSVADDGNKQDLVRNAVLDADEDAAYLAVEELLNLLRQAGYFERDEPAERITALRDAVGGAGHELDEAGHISWIDGGPPSVPASVTSDPSTPGPSEPGSRAAPALPGEVASPSLQLLAWSLRRLGAGGARPLIERRRGRAGLQVDDEYDVQDLVEALLRFLYRDVRPEEPTPSSGGHSSRMDVHLREATTAVEVKVATSSHREGALKSEILVDVNDYREHPTVQHLVVAVYDLDGVMQNPDGFEHDMSRSDDELRVIVVVAPWFGPRTA